MCFANKLIVCCEGDDDETPFTTSRLLEKVRDLARCALFVLVWLTKYVCVLVHFRLRTAMSVMLANGLARDTSACHPTPRHTLALFFEPALGPALTHYVC